MQPRTILLLAFVLTAFTSFSQVTKVPEQAKENFANQYPEAKNAVWYNDLIKVNVQFELGEDKMDAQYNNNGTWKHTLKLSSFEELPATVKDGFGKSKYADREVTDVRIVYLPADVIQYRIKVEKNDIQKKYLFYNTKGRLVRDQSTL